MDRFSFITCQLHIIKSFFDPPCNLFPLETHIERTEGHIFEDGPGKELLIGTLKDETDFTEYLFR